MPEAEGKPTEATLLKEYDIVAASLRFFMGLRFVVLAFTVTLQSALFTLFTRMNSAEHAPDIASTMPQEGRVMLSVIGLFLLGGIAIIERRTIEVHYLMIRRGIQLEIALGLCSVDIFESGGVISNESAHGEDDSLPIPLASL